MINKEGAVAQFAALLDEVHQKFLNEEGHPPGAVVIAPFESDVQLGGYACGIKFRAEIRIFASQANADCQDVEKKWR